jgi:DNA-binding NarL/FixJ family response regulator
MKRELPDVKIAIVDDNALIRESVKFRLNSLGYKVVMEAENGKEFLDMLRPQTAPDICVLDINMPVMDGLETTVQLKKTWPGIKIIFFSMEDSSIYMNKGIQLGADGFVAKDAPFAELNNMLVLLATQTQSQVA